MNPKSELPRFPGMRGVLTLSAIFYLTFAVTMQIFVFTDGLGTRLNETATFLVAQIVAWVATIALGVRASDSNFDAIAALRPFAPRLALPIILASFGLSILTAQVASWIPVPESMQAALEQGFDSPVLGMVAIIIVAPFCEELVFRGLILRGLLSRWSVGAAVFATSLIFAVFHLNPWQAVVALPAGLLCAWLLLATGSMWTAILAHASINGCFPFFTGPLLETGEEPADSLSAYPLPILAIGLLLAAGGLLALRGMLPRAARFRFDLDQPSS